MSTKYLVVGPGRLHSINQFDSSSDEKAEEIALVRETQKWNISPTPGRLGIR